MLVNQIDVNGGYFPHDQKSKLLRKGGRKNVPYIFVNNFFCRRSEAGTNKCFNSPSKIFAILLLCMYTYYTCQEYLFSKINIEKRGRKFEKKG